MARNGYKDKGVRDSLTESSCATVAGFATVGVVVDAACAGVDCQAVDIWAGVGAGD